MQAAARPNYDVSPRSTRPMLDESLDKEEFRSMVEGDVKWFFELLAKLTQVQLCLWPAPYQERMAASSNWRISSVNMPKLTARNGLIANHCLN